MRRGHYLCGCAIEDEKVEFCAIHGQRQYGWRTPLKHHPQGGTVIDYSRSSERQFWGAEVR